MFDAGHPEIRHSLEGRSDVLDAMVIVVQEFGDGQVAQFFHFSLRWLVAQLTFDVRGWYGRDASLQFQLFQPLLQPALK